MDRHAPDFGSASKFFNNFRALPQNLPKRDTFVDFQAKTCQNAGFGKVASGKHRKTRGVAVFVALKQRVWKGHRAETIVKATLFAYRIDSLSRVLTISGPSPKARQNAIHSTISKQKPAKTRVLARWPQESIVKRVVGQFLSC